MKGACAVALAIVIVAAACSSFESTAPSPLDAGAEAEAAPAACSLDLGSDPSNCGVCGRACGEAETCTAGVCLPGCRDGIVHVAPDGDDAKSGCAPTSPKRTIGAALGFAKVAQAQTREIRVCAGTYRAARTVLDIPVSLSGGYGCNTFKRPEDYGYPTFASATVLESEDDETLLVTGKAVDRSVRVDGFVVTGTTRTLGPASAVLVRDGAAPVLSNLKVRASMTSAPRFPSEAVRVASGARVTLERVDLHGGNGVASEPNAVASTGLAIDADAGDVDVHDSTIDGGSGRGILAGAIGVHSAAATRKLAIERSTITGGNGTTSGATAIAPANEAPTQGIAGVVGALELLDNQIRGGKGACGSRACLSIAVNAALPLEGGAIARIERNRIYGGDSVPAAGMMAVHLGMSVIGGTGIIASNVIHIGGVEGATRIGPVNAYGIALGKGSDRIIAHNTLLASPTQADDSVYFIDLTSAEKGAQISGNLFLGTLSANEYGVNLYQCQGASIGALRGNLFASLLTTFAVTSSPGCSPILNERYEWPVDLERRQNVLVAGSASANYRLSGGCTGPTAPQPQCVASAACAAAYPGCIREIVNELDDASFGRANLDGDGLRPKVGGHVCVVSSLANVASGVTTDIGGAARSAPVTIGAFEAPDCP